MPMSPRLLRPANNAFTPKSISGLALWLDASQTGDLYTTDAGPVTAVSSPTEISGCVGWWDASDLSTMRQNSDGTVSVTSPDDPVGYWADKSGNGRHARQSTSGRRPLAKLADRNGLAGLNFDGSDDFFLCDSGANFAAGFAFAVVRRTGTPVAYSAIYAHGPTSNVAGISASAQTFSVQQAGDGAYTGFIYGLQQAGGILRSNGLSFTAVNSNLFNLHHAQLLPNTTDTNILGVQGNINSTVGTQYPTIGLDPFAATRVYPMRLYELIVFDTVPSLATIARVEAYLAAKWGISGVHAAATSASDPVGYWRDRSGNNRHATQATGARRPTLATASLNNRNGLACVEASQQNLLLGNISGAFNSSEGTAFFVYKTGIDNGYCLFRTSSNNSFTHENSSGTRTYNGAWRVTRVNGLPCRLPFATTDPAVVHTLQASASAYQMRNNSALVTDTTGNWSAGNYYSLMADDNGASGQSFTNGFLYETILYSRYLTETERLRLERYLAAKWGITLAPQVSNADAQDWINRVYANGGTVSASTAAAVNQFCNDIDSAGIRDRFYRMGIFAGTGLNAALVPLYRGPSLGGTQYGNSIDTNVGPFVSGDYAETGASGGLQGNRLSTKRLNTGVAGSTFSGHNFHCSSYEIVGSDSTYDSTLGAWTSTGNQGFYYGRDDDSAGKPTFGVAAPNNFLRYSPPAITGQFLCALTGSAQGAIYRNGALAASSWFSGTATVSDWSGVTWDISVFAGQKNSAGTYGEYSSARLGGYSFGLAMNATQAAAYYTAMQAFQTALGRNV